MTSRRHVLNLSILCAAALAAPYAQAQTYPSKPIRIVVPFGPGGATDVVARTVADKLSARLGQPVIVDNKPGASTMIGADAVAKAAPDGYTLMVSGSSTYTVVPALKERMPYDPQKDLALIALLVKAPLVLVSGPSAQVKSLAELVALGKSKPGELGYATFGTGSAPHLAGEMLAHEAGIKVLAVPYKGSAPASMA
ncbi:MAG: tripartite tricarboxylate transporter substrate binding protein, partial [Xylophilus sp.]|nr:tripartite tricarboxylate transporter substrate binding protein [Xylophilus sp.]